MKFNILFSFILLLIISAIGFAQPKVVIREGTSLDFGQTLVGHKTSRDVTVLNVGKDTLHIDYVKAQCGCTATLLKEKVIAPHDSSKLTITFDTKNYPEGKVTKHVYIKSDDTTSFSTMTIEFSTVIVVGLKFEPEFIAYRNAKIDSSYTESLSITNMSKVTITIDSLTSQWDEVVPSVDRKVLLPGQRAILSAVYTPKKAGQNHSKIIIHTDFKDQNEYEASLMLWTTRK